MCAAPAAAQEGAQAPATSASPDATVEVIVVGEPRQLDLLRETFGSEGVPGVRMLWSRESRIQASDVLERQRFGPMARCFVDLRRLPDVVIYFADKGGERFLVRELSLPQGLDELGKEALGQIIESSFEALLEQGGSALNRAQLRSAFEEREEPAPSPSPASGPPEPVLYSAKQRPSAGVGAFYAMRAFTSSSVTHGPGAIVRGELPWQSTRFSLWFSAAYELPQDFSDQVIGLRLSTISLRIGAGLRRRVVPPLWLGARLGIGSDFVDVEPHALLPEQTTTTISRLSRVDVGGIAVDASYEVAPQINVALAAFADIDFVPRHYDVMLNGTTQAFLEPWRVKPGVALAVIFDFGQ